MKKLGMVQGAYERNTNASRDKKQKPNDLGFVLPNGAGAVVGFGSLPTTTAKLSSQLGATDETIRNRVNAVGKATGTKLSPEKTTADDLEAAANKMLALNQAKEVEAARLLPW